MEKEKHKWPAGTRFFEVQKDKKEVIEELIEQGDIESLCDSETGIRFCIATNGCVPTLNEIKAFAADWFEKGEDAWWLAEITENDAKVSYGMDYTPEQRFFTEKDQNRTGMCCFALFLDSEWAHSVTVANGLTLEEARDRYLKLSAPGCEKFIMIERNYHSRDSERYLLLRVKDLGECVLQGMHLLYLISQLKKYPTGDDEFRLVVSRG